MSRRRGWIAIIFGLLFALGAGAMVYFVLQQQQELAAEQARALALAQSAPVATMKLPVAARPLQPGAALTSNDYVMQEFPLNLVPPQAISETAKLDGKLLVQQVGQGETFNTRMFLGGDGATMSQQIEPGNLLVAFPIVDLLSQVNIINDGDRVDVMLSLKNEDSDPATPLLNTALTLQNIPVIKVLRPQDAETNPEARPIALLLSLKPQDAVMLKYIKDIGGVIDLALRSPLDREPSTTQNVADEDVQTQYFPR